MKPGNYYIKKKRGPDETIGEAVVMSDDYVMTTFWENVRAPAEATTVAKLIAKYKLVEKVQTSSGTKVSKNILDIMKEHKVK